MNTKTLVTAREYILEATRWLIEDSIASSVDVVTEFIGSDKIGIQITIFKPTGNETFNFESAWKNL